MTCALGFARRSEGWCPKLTCDENNIWRCSSEL